MATQTDPRDPKGLIREAYRIEGITPAECRSIFLDWALSLPEKFDQGAALSKMHQRYTLLDPAHPMTEVLRQGLETGSKPRRRGGWRSRPRN